MPNPDKKRRAEKDLKELWQYIDAKYFQKVDKYHIISKADQIFREICPQQFADNSLKKQDSSQRTLRMGGLVIDEANNSSQTKILRKRPQPEGVIAQIPQVEPQRKFQRQNRQLKLHQSSELVPRDWRFQDSILNEETIETKGGFRQFYSNILEKMNLTTNWTMYINKNSQNGEFKAKLERNVIHAQIRNIFDIEFNKKFQGQIQLPLKIQCRNNYYHSQSNNNKYLFFITDKFEDEAKIENEQKHQMIIEQQQDKQLKFMYLEQQRLESIQQDIKSRPQLRIEPEDSGLGFIDAGPTSFGIVDNPESVGKIPIKKGLRPKKAPGKAGNLGFMASSSDDEEAAASFLGHSPARTDEIIPKRKFDSDDHALLLEALRSQPGMSLDELKETTIDEEIEKLEELHSSTQEQLSNDLQQLSNKVLHHQEPESIQILSSKIDKEREYIQTQIIQMEIKQMAESITRVTHAMKVSNTKHQQNQTETGSPRQTRGAVSMKESAADEAAQKAAQRNQNKSAKQRQAIADSVLLQDLAGENVGHKNRPYLLKMILQKEKKEANSTRRGGSGTSSPNNSKKKSNSQRQVPEQSPTAATQGRTPPASFEHIFRIEFDISTGVPPSWIDTKTLNYLNQQRDNIFASSGQYDLMIHPRGGAANTKNMNGANRAKNKGSPIKAGGTAGSQDAAATGGDQGQLVEALMNKESVAYQRGKRSCTMADLKSKGKGGKVGFKKANGLKSVGSAKGMPMRSLLEQGQQAIKNSQQFMNMSDQSQQAEYDFCHNCKQLKNKYLLVSCKYSSKVSSSASQKQGFIYNPYPYEPQSYTVNKVKIHNIDFQNRAQMRGLIELIRKDLRLKNTGIEAARQSMQEFLSERYQQAYMDSHKTTGGSTGTQGCSDDLFDIATFQHNNQQLMAYLQDLDINPYTLDPQKQQQFFTDIKLLFPNLHQELYPLPTNLKRDSHGHSHSHGHKGGSGLKGCSPQSSSSSHSGHKQITYKCNRKFCTFCLRTNYEESLNDIMKNKNWHCHHCTGYCICTRCLRQDIITQLKAYLISLGGNLNILRDQSMSLFDSQILKNYNQHLELTLGQNQWLYQKYPYFLKMMMGQSFTDPTKVVQVGIPQSLSLSSGSNQGQMTPSFGGLAYGSSDSKMGLSANNGSQMAQKSPFASFGFMHGSNKDNFEANSAKKGSKQDKIMSYSNLSMEKVAISQLFRYSLLNMKMDDQNNMVSLQNKASFGSNSNELSQKISDKRYLEQIIRSIRGHDMEVINRIQKRRGRKKFILSSSGEENASQDISQTNYLNKRDKKYLNKMNQFPLEQSQNSNNLNNFGNSDQHQIFNQAVIFDDIKEFQEDWPKSSSKSLQQIDRMLNMFGLNKKIHSTSDYATNFSQIGKLLSWKNKIQKSGSSQKCGKYSLNASKYGNSHNDSKSSLKKKQKSSLSRKKKGKVLRLRPQSGNQSKKANKK